MRIELAREFRLCFDKESHIKHKKPIDYFTRTRPGEEPPAWVKNEYEDAEFLNFLIHLEPLSEELTAPDFESDGCICWTYRKTDKCPRGIKI